MAEALEEAALSALREKSPDRVLETNVEFWAAVVLEIADIPPAMYPPMFGCARVAGWSAHIIEQKRTGRLIRPSARYVGPPARSTRRDGLTRRLATLRPGERARRAGLGARARRPAREVGRGARGLAARSSDYRERAVAYRAIGQFRFRAKIELLRRGLEDESPACRGSALLSLERLSRDHPGDVNAVRPLLHELATSDGNQAVRRLAIMALRNGSPQRDTIGILAALGDDDEQDRELREAATKVAQYLRKKAGPGK